MQYIRLNKSNNQNNKNLIVFFNGWGMNETPIKHLDIEDFDVLIFSDYRDLEFDFDKFGFNKYLKKYLICWSMGVYTVNKFKNIFNNFDKKIAINGTTSVVNDNFGIPEKIYNITIKLLNEESLDKFIKNMFDNGKINPNVTITRDIKDLKEELIKIKDTVFDDEITFDKAIISTNDRIIPTKNQIKFWNNKTQVELIEATHCPFEKYTKWSQLIC